MTNFEMFIAITSLPELSITLGTRVWLLAGMNKNMIFESIGSVEALSALFASIAALAFVNQSVLVVNGTSEEAFVANFASKIN